MELFDYLRLRWRLLVPVFLLGVLVIFLLGRSSGSSNYVADAEMLVSPPSDQLNVYGGDSSRYIATEMRLLLQPSVVNAAATKANVSTSDIRRSITYTSDSNDSFVTLVATNPSRKHAIAIANAMATAYLSNAKARARAPYDEQQATLQKKINEVSSDLKAINTKIQTETVQAQESTDTKVTVSSNTFLLDNTRSNLLLGQLQGLQQQQQNNELTGQPQINSSLLREAKSTTQPGGWGPTTYLAGVAGWFLVLLALTGLTVTLSRRLLGPARWHDVAAGLHLRRAIRLLRGPSLARGDGLDRVARVAEAAEPTPTLLTYLPARSRALDAATNKIRKKLGDGDGDGDGDAEGQPKLHEMATLADVQADTADDVSPVLLMVDVSRCLIEDAESLQELPESLQRRIVPVLV